MLGQKKHMPLLFHGSCIHRFQIYISQLWINTIWKKCYIVADMCFVIRLWCLHKHYTIIALYYTDIVLHKWSTEDVKHADAHSMYLLKWKQGFFGKSIGCCFAGATHKGIFNWSRHRWKDVLLKQACEKTHDEGFFANNIHVLFGLILHS